MAGHILIRDGSRDKHSGPRRCGVAPEAQLKFAKMWGSPEDVLMPQCPSCRTYATGEASFCSQCGAWLGGPRQKRRRRGGLRMPVVTAALILTAALGVLGISLLAPTRTRTPASGRESLSIKSGEAAPMLAAQEVSRLDEGVSSADVLDTDGAPQDPGQLAGAAASALVVLDLRAEDDRPWREARGIVVSSEGVVLCRLSALLGAYRGMCRLSRPREGKAEILGVSGTLDVFDLALVRLSPATDARGYSALPVAETQPDVNASVFTMANGRMEAAVVDAPQWRGPDGIPRILLAESPPVSGEAFAALDAQGAVLGLCKVESNDRFLSDDRPRPSDGFRVHVDPAAGLERALDDPVVWTLRELTLRLYDGTFQDFFLRGVQAFQQKRWRDAVDSLEKALGRVDVDQPDPADVALATADLRESYLEEIRRLVESRRVEEASRLIESALARFPSDAILLLALGEARLNLRDWAGAIEALVMAREIEPNGRVDSLLEKAYLEIAADAARANDVRAQELRLVEGVQRLPSSGPLHFELGKLYARLEAYDDAIAYLHRASELEATLRDAAEGLLARIDDVLKRRDAVVVPIPQGSKSIRTEAVVDESVTFTFLIDTGATYTSIPADLARTLGYDTTSVRLPRVTISGVGGVFEVPMIRLASLNLGGYAVRNLDVLVLPKALGPDFGLIGLNFLKHFRYTVDATRSEFRIERP